VPSSETGLHGKVRVRRSDQETVIVRAVLQDQDRHELIVSHLRLDDESQDTMELSMDFPKQPAPDATRRLVLQATSTLPKNRALVAWGPILWKRKGK
jgi:hypothetical protein